MCLEVSDFVLLQKKCCSTIQIAMKSETWEGQSLLAWLCEFNWYNLKSFPKLKLDSDTDLVIVYFPLCDLDALLVYTAALIMLRR